MLAFGSFGLLWGLFAAALPVIKAKTGTGDGEFGTALVFIALAAAPTMFVVGRLLDRLGRRVAVVAALLFCAVTPLPTLADSFGLLVLTLALFGAGSGAFDVVINSLAATVEAESGVRVLNRAHALFSAGLLVGSLLIAGFTAASLSISVTLAGFALVTAVFISMVLRRAPPNLGRSEATDDGSVEGSKRERVNRIVIAFGLLAALAALIESGIQQWSAVFLDQEVGASAALAGLAPGVFAASMAVGRIGGHRVQELTSSKVLLVMSAGVSALGVLAVATADTSPLVLAGFAIVGIGISVAAPTVYSLAAEQAPPEIRGATIGTTASVGYAGLLLGPVVVGQVAGLTSLRGAVGGLAIVALVLGVGALRLPDRAPSGARARAAME
jgi:MFS family permease